MTIAYIGVGSNLDYPAVHVSQAINKLSKIENTQLIFASKLYRSKAVGMTDQPDFINAVVKLDTLLSAQNLLLKLQGIELSHGRVRGGLRFGPRTLDLDVLLFGDEIIDNSSLTVPHPRMFERAFVLVPLAEIEPTLIFPDGSGVQQCLQNIEEAECQILE